MVLSVGLAQAQAPASAYACGKSLDTRLQFRDESVGQQKLFDCLPRFELTQKLNVWRHMGFGLEKIRFLQKM